MYETLNPIGRKWAEDPQPRKQLTLNPKHSCRVGTLNHGSPGGKPFSLKGNCDRRCCAAALDPESNKILGAKPCAQKGSPKPPKDILRVGNPRILEFHLKANGRGKAWNLQGGCCDVA